MIAVNYLILKTKHSIQNQAQNHKNTEIVKAGGVYEQPPDMYMYKFIRV